MGGTLCGSLRWKTLVEIRLGGIDNRFNIIQQSRGAESEQMRRQPFVAERLLDHCHPLDGVFDRLDATGRLQTDLNLKKYIISSISLQLERDEVYLLSSFGMEILNGPNHDESDR